MRAARPVLQGKQPIGIKRCVRQKGVKGEFLDQRCNVLHVVSLAGSPALKGSGKVAAEDLVRRFDADQLHKSWGAVIFCMALLRAGWRLSHQVSPQMPPHMPAWQVRAARLSHLALYLLLFALPISGWVYASASPLQTLLGIENRVFNTFVLPDPWSVGDTVVADVAYFVHRACALGLVLCLSVHIAAALKHHFVDRDGILLRILP